MTRALNAGHPERAPRRGRAKDLWIPAFAGMALIACGGAPVIKSQVLTPPPSAPRSEFYVEKPEVKSREAGEEIWQQNAEYGRLLVDMLKLSLHDKGKTLATPPTDLVRSRIYLAYTDIPMKGKSGRTAKAHVEVQLQLVDSSGVVRYSTHTRAPVAVGRFASWFGGPTSSDEVIRGALRQAAEDFVSRL